MLKEPDVLGHKVSSKNKGVAAKARDGMKIPLISIAEKA